MSYGDPPQPCLTNTTGITANSCADQCDSTLIRSSTQYKFIKYIVKTNK